ncbi:hypothetical protein N7512_010428 [Penicillium capsulatum]|nr:hypothetical protein N7512_010428 [Penicillium capsulatum]
MSFYFTATPPTGNTPQKPLPTGDTGEENRSCASFTPDSISRRRRHGEYMQRAPLHHAFSSISRTLSSLTTRSSATHVGQEQKDIQQPTAAESPENANDHDHLPEPGIALERLPTLKPQVHEPALTTENLEKLNRSTKKRCLDPRPSPTAMGTVCSVSGMMMPLDTPSPPTRPESTRLRYFRDARCIPRTPWAFKEGSLVIGIDPSYVEWSPHQPVSSTDTHELKPGKMYVICRMYTDMWALCIEVSLDFPPPLDSWPPLGVNVGFLPLCAVTLPVNYASFLQRCEGQRNFSETPPSCPSHGQCLNVPLRSTSLGASSDILNPQQNTKRIGIPVPRMVHEIYDNFLSLLRQDGDSVVYRPAFREDLHDKAPWIFRRMGRWRVKMPRKPPIHFTLPDPVTGDSPGTSEGIHVHTMPNLQSMPQLSLYRYPPVPEPEQHAIRRLILRVFRC